MPGETPKKGGEGSAGREGGAEETLARVKALCPYNLLSPRNEFRSLQIPTLEDLVSGERKILHASS